MGAQVPALTQAAFNYLFIDSVSGSRTPSVPEEGLPRNCAPMSRVDNPNSMKLNGTQAAGTELRCWRLSSLRSHFREHVPWRGPHPQAPPRFHSHADRQEAALMPLCAKAYKSHQHGSALQGLSKHFCKAQTP